MLFIVSNSPFFIDFNCLIDTLNKNDDLLLLQDGVLIGQDKLIKKNGNFFLDKLILKKVNIYALKDDVEVRGLYCNYSSLVFCISYRDFVKLTVKNKVCFFW